MKNNRFVAAVLIPAYLFIGLFSLFPVLYGIGISFFDYNPVNSVQPFVWMENYLKLLEDSTFRHALVNTLVFCVVAVALNVVLSMFLARMIFSVPWRWLRVALRVAIFIPCVAPKVGTALIWKHGILDTKAGVLNQLVKLLGGSSVNWYTTTWPLFAIIIVFTLWSDIGYNTILFTAGLEGVPEELEEAADLDGAGPFRKFVQITLPLMRRTFAFVSIMTVVDYFQHFAQFRVLAANGGMNDSAMVLTNYIYQTSFRDYDMGYASAMSTVLFLMILAVSLFQNRMLRANWDY